MKRRQKTQDSGSAPHGGGTATLDRDALPIVAGGDGAQRPRLGQVLLDQNLVSPDALSTALDLQQASGRRLGAILVESGLVDPNVLNEALAHHFGVETVDLRRLRPEPIDRASVRPNGPGFEVHLGGDAAAIAG